MPTIRPDTTMRTIRPSACSAGADGAAIIDDLVRLATPGIRAMTGPRFFGWVIGGSHPTGVAADWLTAAWGQNAGNVLASPASCAVEAESRIKVLAAMVACLFASFRFTGGIFRPSGKVINRDSKSLARTP